MGIESSDSCPTPSSETATTRTFITDPSFEAVNSSARSPLPEAASLPFKNQSISALVRSKAKDCASTLKASPAFGNLTEVLSIKSVGEERVRALACHVMARASAVTKILLFRGIIIILSSLLLKFLLSLFNRQKLGRVGRNQLIF